MAQKQKQKTGGFTPPNKGKIIGAKAISSPEHVQMLKLRLSQENKQRDWLLLSLGINRF